MAEVSFGEWLKRRRSALGLTQEQLARQIHCSTSALRKFESEERRPSAEVIEQLAEIFHIPPAERKSFLRYARGDWQAISGGETDEEPWQRSRPIVRSNLPASTTSFIGREKEQAEIINLLDRHRLVTLVGAGGIGKTRLSLEVAHEVLNTFPDGLWFIEFAPLADPALVLQAIVNTLGLIEQANRPPQTMLTDFLKAKKSCLVLDNCEHLIQASAELAEALLRACPELHILATSREALGISGESTFNVLPLSTPDIRQSSTTESLTRYEAVELFLERAQTAVSGFALTQDNSLAIAQICHYLDGIPLAIELAATRVRGLSVEQIASRLDDRFRLLTSGNRTALPRHQTLQALIDWSYDLLTEPERVLLRRLSVFAGGWTLEAAEAACAGDGLESHQILDMLLRLVDKSLIVAETQGMESRYRMLETIRQYALKKLWAAGEGELLCQRHLAYFVDLAERAEPNLRAFDMIMWLDRLEAELDNIRVALEWAQESDVESQLRLASALLWFWHIRTHKNEGIDWLERGLSIEAAERGDQPLTSGRAMILGKSLNASGFLIAMGVELQKAKTHFEESLSLLQRLGPAGKQGMAYALLRLGSFDYTSEGKKLIEQSLSLFREMGDKFGAAESLMFLSGGVVDDDYKQAVIFEEEHLALRREIGDHDGLASGLGNLGSLAFMQGDYHRATTLFEECLAMFRKLGNKWAISRSSSIRGLGDFYFWQGDYERAVQIYRESIALAQEIGGDRFILAGNTYSLGVIAQLQGDYVRAKQIIIDSLMVFREEGHIWLIAGSLHTLGDITLAQGDDKSAAQWYETELAYSQEKQFRPGLIFASIGQGKVAWINGDYEQAIELFEDVIKKYEDTKERPAIFHAFYWLGQIAQSQGNYANAYANYIEMLKLQQQRIKVLFNSVLLKAYFCSIAYPLGALGTLATLQDKMERGARLLSAAQTQYPPLCFEMSARERAEHDQAIAAARTALGGKAFAAAWQQGKKMTLDEAIAYALES